LILARRSARIHAALYRWCDVLKSATAAQDSASARRFVQGTDVADAAATVAISRLLLVVPL
jgi:hypothetical protein